MRGNKRKYYAIILSLFLALFSVSGFVGTNVYAETPSDPVAVSFSTNAQTSDKIQYKIGDATEFTDAANGTEIKESALTSSKIITLKAIPGTGRKLDTHENQIFVHYNNTDYPITGDDLTKLSAGTYQLTYTEGPPINVRINFDNAGGGSTSVSAGKYVVDIVQSVPSKTGKITVEFLNGSNEVLGTLKEYTASDSTETAIPEGATKVRVSVTAESEWLNNARLLNSTDQSEVDLIDDIRQDETGHSATKSIDITKGYNISIIFSNTMSVSWSYDRDTAAEDQLVEHARIELLKSDNATDYTEQGRTDWQLTIGQTYYFVLIPDYGYQIKGLNINGQEITPQNSVGVFKFVMSHSNFHFQGIVEPAEDKASYQENGLIGGMSVEGVNAVNSGNILVSESDATLDTTAVTQISDESASAVGTVDLLLKQIISKGNGTYWESNKSNSANPVNISMILPRDGLESGRTYSIIRKHGETYEELNAVYNMTRETLEFQTDKFSEYTIITKDGEPEVDSAPEYSGGNSSETPSQTNTSSLAPTPEPAMSEAIGGIEINGWNDVVTVLETKVSEVKNELVELKLSPSNAIIPVETFKALAKSEAEGIHLFTGNGTALTFENDSNLSLQNAVDLSCVNTEEPGKKTIEFKGHDVLVANVIMHSVVPVGTQKVTVYITTKEGTRKILFELIPNEKGRFCFPIKELGKYELIY